MLSAAQENCSPTFYIISVNVPGDGPELVI